MVSKKHKKRERLARYLNRDGINHVCVETSDGDIKRFRRSDLCAYIAGREKERIFNWVTTKSNFGDKKYEHNNTRDAEPEINDDTSENINQTALKARTEKYKQYIKHHYADETKPRKSISWHMLPRGHTMEEQHGSWARKSGKMAQCTVSPLDLAKNGPIEHHKERNEDHTHTAIVQLQGQKRWVHRRMKRKIIDKMWQNAESHSSWPYNDTSTNYGPNSGKNSDRI